MERYVEQNSGEFSNVNEETFELLATFLTTGSWSWQRRRSNFETKKEADTICVRHFGR